MAKQKTKTKGQEFDEDVGVKEFLEQEGGLGELCEKAGFIEIFSGPVQEGFPGVYKEDRSGVQNVPGNLYSILINLDVDQSDIPFSPKEHFLFARPVGQEGVEMFHFWDPGEWRTRGQEQVVQDGLTYFCWPNNDRIVHEIKRQTRIHSNGKILLGPPLGSYPDKWDYLALEILAEYAGIVD